MYVIDNIYYERAPQEAGKLETQPLGKNRRMLIWGADKYLGVLRSLGMVAPEIFISEALGKSDLMLGAVYGATRLLMAQLLDVFPGKYYLSAEVGQQSAYSNQGEPRAYYRGEYVYSDGRKSRIIGSAEVGKIPFPGHSLEAATEKIDQNMMAILMLTVAETINLGGGAISRVGVNILETPEAIVGRGFNVTIQSDILAAQMIRAIGVASPNPRNNGMMVPDLN